MKSYRPDIDGLRAYAILSVILFHAGFDVFSGGYIGVDVFFVVSGFLITNNIFNDVVRGSFSFSNFYLRRARRLFPAAFFTFLITFIGASLLFSPEHLARLGKSLIFALLSVSNIFFWSESGYFDTASEFKPLLHTWSLAVEEQFYLVWPLCLFFLLKINRTWVAPVFLIVCGCLSLFYSERWILSDPHGAFFLAPFRIAELAIGSVCVWLVRFQPNNKTLLEPLVLAGLLAIIIPVFTYSEKTPFPGINVLLPALGTALIIYSGKANYIAKIINNRVAIGIGLISYSLYLAHWPLLVFYQYGKADPISAVEKLGLIMASFFVATLMYFYVEKPFRTSPKNPAWLRPSRFAGLCVGLALTLVIPGGHAWLNDGWKWRIASDIQQLTDNLEDSRSERFLPFNRRCGRSRDECMVFDQDKINIVVFGDSHGVDGYNIMALSYPQANIVLASNPSCPPYIDVEYFLESRPNIVGCREHNDFIFSRWTEISQADIIVFSMLQDNQSVSRLNDTIDWLRPRSNARFLVLGTAMIFNKDVPTVISSLESVKQVEAAVMANARTALFETDLLFRENFENSDVLFVSKLDQLCPGRQCQIVLDDGELLTYDRHHLSVGAARIVAEHIKKLYPEPEALR